MFLFLSSKMIDMELSDIRPLIEFYHSHYKKQLWVND